jgi:hypothetical protein
MNTQATSVESAAASIPVDTLESVIGHAVTRAIQARQRWQVLNAEQAGCVGGAMPPAGNSDLKPLFAPLSPPVAGGIIFPMPIPLLTDR